MNFLTISVALSLIMCLIFTVAVMILAANGIEIPDTLIQYFFMTFGLELGAAAAIQIAKYRINKSKTTEKIELLKENNIEVSHCDISNCEEDDFEENVYYG